MFNRQPSITYSSGQVNRHLLPQPRHLKKGTSNAPLQLCMGKLWETEITRVCAQIWDNVTCWVKTKPSPFNPINYRDWGGGGQGIELPWQITLIHLNTTQKLQGSLHISNPFTKKVEKRENKHKDWAQTTFPTTTVLPKEMKTPSMRYHLVSLFHL